MSERSSPSSVNLVIDAYLQHGTISRSDLAALTEISPSAITELTQNLLEMGLLEELATMRERQGRGRPATALRFNAAHGYFIGVSIGDTPSPIVLADLQGNVVAEQAILTTDDPGGSARTIQCAIEELARESKVSETRLLGIGVAISGVVDESAGVCRYSAARNWRDVPIGKIVHEATGIPTYIANDADAVAIGEKLFGKARLLRNFASITLGGTVGCAQYMFNKLYSGYDGGAGEIGHVTLDVDGPVCLCGKRGCLDLYAGSTALIAMAQSQDLACESAQELEKLAARGSAKAQSILRQGANALGLAIASLIQINNPECVLIADIAGFGKGIFQTTVRQVAENNILPRLLASTEIKFHQVDRNFLARAAASIAARQYLQVRHLTRTRQSRKMISTT